MKTIACYGTLKKGQYNHIYIGQKATLVGKSKVRGAMFLYQNSYSHLLKESEAPEAKQVTEHDVEIYNVEDNKYQQISAMELGSGYKEEIMEFTLEDGSKAEATIFFTEPVMKPEAHLPWIKSFPNR